MDLLGAESGALGVDENLVVFLAGLRGEVEETAIPDDGYGLTLADVLARLDQRFAQIGVDDPFDRLGAVPEHARRIELQLADDSARAGIGANDRSVAHREHMRS